MTPEQWHRVKEVFAEALERDSSQRAAFLDGACDGDDVLRGEVNSLIESYELKKDFMSAPAMAAAAPLLLDQQAKSLVGQMVRHYKIIAAIRAGGMGEVYLAQDTRLGRQVAIKLLPTHLSSDRDRLRRFEQEARAASSLNHPNVCMIHEVGEMEDGRHYIVMEHIEGVTLRERLASKPIELREALDAAVQVASALEAAHAAGVVHRDIKPENIMLRRDGYVKVLDFGLAKLTEQLSEPPSIESEAPTRGMVKTESGVVMGTVAYMSPEQTRGLEVDGRTDIWSLGVVLYEMVAGRVPFAGETNSDLIVSILEREPTPLTRLSPPVPALPAELQRIISKSLRKDREERYQLVEDLLLDLKSVRQELDLTALLRNKDGPYHLSRDPVSDLSVPKPAAGSEAHIGTEGERAVPGSDRAQLPGEKSDRSNWVLRLAQRRFVRWLLAIAILSLIVAVTLIIESRPPPPPRIVNTVQLTNDGRDKNFFQLATDGSRVYFLEDWGQAAGFAQVPTTSGESTLVPATFLDGPGQGALYDISLARSELLVGKEHLGEESTLWVMSVLGGPGRRLADLRGHSACWSPDGQRVAYANGRDLYIAKSDGTESRKLLSFPVPADGLPADSTPANLSWSPDGSKFRFHVGYSLWEVSADGTNLHPLLPGWKSQLAQWGGRWTPDGRYYVFLVNSSWLQPDIWALRETKNFFGKADREPIQLTFGPMRFGPPVFSPDGKRLFAMGAMPHGELVRYDVPSAHWASFLSGMSANYVAFSRDGQWVTYVTFPEQALWRSRADGSQRLQLTAPGMEEVMVPRWSPDGKQIAFWKNVFGQPSQIYVVSAEGGKVEQLLQTSCSDVCPTWSPDGNRLVFARLPGPSCKAAIYLLDLKSHQVSIIAGSEGLYGSIWSPDGSSIAALTLDNSRLMLYSFATQRWEEAVNGFVSDLGWSHDGRFVYFMNDSDVLRVRIADHKVEKVASPTGVSSLSWWLGLAPDDSPLRLRETTVQQLYALDWVAP